MEAAGTGQYVWSRAGFLPHPYTWKNVITKNIVQSLNSLNLDDAHCCETEYELDALKHSVYDILTDDPRNIRDIALLNDDVGEFHHFGKHLLTDMSTFDLGLNLNDQESLEWLYDYCQKKN